MSLRAVQASELGTHVSPTLVGRVQWPPIVWMLCLISVPKAPALGPRDKT